MISEERKGLFDNSQEQQEHVQKTAPRHDDDDHSEKKRVVQEWLQSFLPNIYPADLELYSLLLVKEGFDSIEMLEEELLEEDLQFMKTAHRRALLRRVKLGGRSMEGGNDEMNKTTL